MLYIDFVRRQDETSTLKRKSMSYIIYLERMFGSVRTMKGKRLQFVKNNKTTQVVSIMLFETLYGCIIMQ